MKTDEQVEGEFRIVLASMAILANVVKRYGPTFAERVLRQAEQYAQSGGRDYVDPEDVKAALYILL